MDKHVSDLDAERLFAGASAPEPAEPLTRFTADVRATFCVPPVEPTRAAHLQAMTQTRAGLVAAPTPAKQGSKRRRRFVVRGTIAAAGLVLVGGSALAATGTLPDVAQDAVSKVAKAFGVKLPRAHSGDVPTLRTDFDHPDLQIETTDEKKARDDDDRDSTADSDSDDGSIGTTDLGTRRPRRGGDDTTVVDDGGSSSSGGDPSSGDGGDGGSVIDDRGDPSGGGDTGDGGSDPAPDDGGGTDPGSGDGGSDGGDGGRGDPKDGSPTGADAPPDAPAP